MRSLITVPLTHSLTGDDDIVERALLRLLCPVGALATPQVETAYKKKFRRHKGAMATAPLTGEAERVAQPARIFVHEILSAHTLSVCWSDAQTGHYAEQVWRLGLARDVGFCALSGRPIVPGDDVFRPRRSVVCVPANWNRMILASVVSMGWRRAGSCRIAR
jgi:hypothetical protein